MKIRTCAVILCAAAIFADEDWMDVTITQGSVRGRLNDRTGLYEFYNIPYATAPTGVHKFKAPLAAPKWSSLYQTRENNFVCPQALDQNILKEKLVIDVNNCLTVNVFVPKTSEDDLKSVLVYVHGGAFTIGYGNINKASKFLRTRDVIMVTFNYRLGVHGFLCLGTEDIPGNAGMKDQVALLRWVQQNIASFGGNPGEVTIAGSSTGSASVDLLILSKTAEGLFHRVIPESGGNLAAFAIQREPLEIAKYHAKKLNFTKIDDARALEEFYKMAPLSLLTSLTYEYFDRTDSTFLFSPCIERNTGERPFLTESPLSILKKGNFTKVPMLYGFTSMEGLLRIDSFDEWKHGMNEKFSDFLPADLKFKTNEQREEVAEKIKLFYFGKESIGDNNVLGFVNYFSDVMITYPMLRAVPLYFEAGNNQVYLYEYSFLIKELGPFPTIRGGDHCAQSVAWLDNFNGENESSASRKYQDMRKIMRDIWHNFIKTGRPVPQGSRLPTWPSVGADRSPHMSLGARVELRGVLLEERTRFWDDIYQKFYRDAIPPPTPYQRMLALVPTSNLVRRNMYPFGTRMARAILLAMAEEEMLAKRSWLERRMLREESRPLLMPNKQFKALYNM